MSPCAIVFIPVQSALAYCQHAMHLWPVLHTSEHKGASLSQAAVRQLFPVIPFLSAGMKY